MSFLSLTLLIPVFFPAIPATVHQILLAPIRNIKNIILINILQILVQLPPLRDHPLHALLRVVLRNLQFLTVAARRTRIRLQPQRIRAEQERSLLVDLRGLLPAEKVFRAPVKLLQGFLLARDSEQVRLVRVVVLFEGKLLAVIRNLQKAVAGRHRDDVVEILRPVLFRLLRRFVPAVVDVVYVGYRFVYVPYVV